MRAVETAVEGSGQAHGDDHARAVGIGIGQRVAQVLVRAVRVPLDDQDALANQAALGRPSRILTMPSSPVCRAKPRLAASVCMRVFSGNARPSTSGTPRALQ